MEGVVRKAMNKAISIVYPKRCLFCDEVLSFGEKKPICAECKPDATWVTGDICKKCGKPLECHRLDLCYDCSRKVKYYNEGRGMWVYEDSVKKAIHKYKYGNRKGYGKAFAEELYQFYVNNIHWDIDCITSVPLHPAKLKERSFNQSALIADILGERLDIGVDNYLLSRTKNTIPQKDLTDSERILNVMDAFSINILSSSTGKNILIVDDIYTTGSTINSCAKILKTYGAYKVYFLTVAIGKGL
ncbi:MAG: amidophosphoribosyltransferase [Firmicutes bacterium HGW-Firmicutes-1]|jgi:ComF family protein|nr:MAG: amidophosphoribosyltransferase [Firmicutes bacterium HGW-Firmicutes-1]